MTIADPPLAAMTMLSELSIHLQWTKRIRDDARVLVARIRHKKLADEVIWIAHDPTSLDALCERFFQLLADIHMAAQSLGIGQPAKTKSEASNAGRRKWA